VKTVFGNETLDPEDMDLWDKSLEFLKNEEPEKALVAMCLMRKHTSKTMFNMSEIYRKLGSYEDALKVGLRLQGKKASNLLYLFIM